VFILLFVDTERVVIVDTLLLRLVHKEGPAGVRGDLFSQLPQCTRRLGVTKWRQYPLHYIL